MKQPANSSPSVPVERKPEHEDLLEFLNYQLYVDPLNQIGLDRRAIVNTLNPHSYVVAERDEMFRRALQQADILLPDGVGIVWACRVLKRKSIRRVSGMDAFLHFLNVASVSSDENKRRVFFLGSSPSTLEKIHQRIRTEYPSLVVGSYSPPYKDAFSNEDQQSMLNAVRDFRPHFLFVGMTAPKQEKWVFQNQHDLSATIICSIGAVFDYYAGTIRRPGAFWRRIGMEWFIRFLREPKRLWKRNLVSNPQFVLRVLRLKFSN